MYLIITQPPEGRKMRRENRTELKKKLEIDFLLVEKDIDIITCVCVCVL